MAPVLDHLISITTQCKFSLNLSAIFQENKAKPDGDVLMSHFYFRYACSIELPDMFILTGGEHSMKKVSQYSISGWMDDLPELNEGRRDHGCGFFFNDNMERVGIRNLN